MGQVSLNKNITRRGFLATLAMWGTLLASYGAGGLMAFRYLLPERKPKQLRKMYVASLSQLQPGKVLKFKLPDGNEALIFQLGEEVLAFSNTCPHLGCKVKWQLKENQFFCPCHDGIFDPKGTAIAGPPAAEKKNLRRYDTEVVGESLFIQVEEA